MNTVGSKHQRPLSNVLHSCILFFLTESFFYMTNYTYISAIVMVFSNGLCYKEIQYKKKR